jgi:hypothetical protein
MRVTHPPSLFLVYETCVLISLLALLALALQED